MYAKRNIEIINISTKKRTNKILNFLFPSKEFFHAWNLIVRVFSISERCASLECLNSGAQYLDRALQDEWRDGGARKWDKDVRRKEL